MKKKHMGAFLGWALALWIINGAAHATSISALDVDFRVNTTLAVDPLMVIGATYPTEELAFYEKPPLINPGEVSGRTDSIPIPEPLTMLLLGSGLVIAAGWRRRR